MQNQSIHLQQPNQPHGSDQQYSTPEQAFEGLETVPMTFPQSVLLSLTAEDRLKAAGGAPLLHGQILFHSGINEVSSGLSDHWYLKAHGVSLYTGPEAA